MEYRFWLPGEPVAQARARTGKGHAYYPAKSANYRTWAVLQLRKQFAGQPKSKGPYPSILGPVKLYLQFFRVRPKSNKSAWPIVRPDLDNYVKMVCDALMDAGVLADDSQVCGLDAGKFWAEANSDKLDAYEPGVEIVVVTL